MTLLGIVGMFVAALVLDYADSRNTQAVTSRHPHAAARWSVMMYVLGLVGIEAALDVSYWYAVPSALGLYVGSILAVRREPSPGAPCSTCTCHTAE